jgi:hypothetical protein
VIRHRQNRIKGAGHIDDEFLTPWQVEAKLRKRTDQELNLFNADVEVEKLILDVVSKGVEDVNVADSLIAGEVTRSIETSSNISITVHDQSRAIIESGALEDEDGELLAVDVRLDGLWFRLAKIEKQTDDLVLTLEDRDIARLRGKKGPRKAASRAKVTRAQYVLQLIRSVKVRRIPVSINELDKKQRKAKAGKKEREDVRDRRRSKGFDKGEILEGKEGTLNKSQLDNASRVIAVADDLDAPDKATLALIEACIVEGPDFKNPNSGEGTSIGILQLTDQHHMTPHQRRDIEKVAELFLKKGFTGSGGAIELAKKNPNRSAGWIAQEVQGSGHPERYDKYRGKARLILRAWGSTAGTAAAYKRYEFKVEKKETYWDAIQRLAKEVNWRAFMSAGRFYFISEKDLFASRARYRFSENSPGVTNIDFQQDYRKKVFKATVSCRIDRWGAPPGTVVIMESMGMATGRWLVMSITRSLFSPEATIELKKPRREKLEPRPEVQNQGEGAVGGEDTAIQGTGGGAKGIVDRAVTIAQTAGGAGVYVGSDLRAGDTVDSGEPSDHSKNNADLAARDIGVRGINLLTGPPSPKLDKAILALGEAFDRDYSSAKHGPFQNADSFHWRGFRIQIIWRTPQWGGHMGHIHIGAKRDPTPAGSVWNKRHRGPGGT